MPKITELPKATAVNDTDIAVIVQDGETKQVPKSVLAPTVPIDTEMSETSENPVQNKVAKAYTDLSVTPKKLIFFKTGKNLFDKNDLINGYALALNGTNTIVAVETMSVSPEITVEPGSDYTVSIKDKTGSTSMRSIEIYSDGTCAYKTINVGPNDYLFQTRENTVAIRISGKTDDISAMQIEKGSKKTAYEEYKLYIPSVYIDSYIVNSCLSNSLFGKKAVFNGDSILELPYGWHMDLCAFFGMTYKNYAKGGSALASYAGSGTPEKTRDPIVERYTEMDADADIVFISAGTNDWWYSWCPLGEDGDTVTTTFRGALHTLIKGLLDMYPNKIIVFVTPIKRGDNPARVNGNGDTLEDFANAMIDVCNQYGIPCLDMFRTCPLNPSIQSQQEQYFDGSKNEDFGYAKLYNDTTHPNVYGSKVQARTAIGFLKSIC